MVTKALGNPSCTVSLGEKSAAPAYRMSWSIREEWCRIFAGTGVAPPVAEVGANLSPPLIGVDGLFELTVGFLWKSRSPGSAAAVRGGSYWGKMY